MPRFQVECVDRESGQGSLKVCNARDAEHAREIAARAGFIVGPVNRLVVVRPANGVKLPPAFLGVVVSVALFIGFTLLIWAGLSRGKLGSAEYFRRVDAAWNRYGGLDLPPSFDPDKGLAQAARVALAEATDASSLARELQGLNHGGVDPALRVWVDAAMESAGEANLIYSELHELLAYCAQQEEHYRSGNGIAEAFVAGALGAGESYAMTVIENQRIVQERGKALARRAQVLSATLQRLESEWRGELRRKFGQ